jgi:DNA-binding SARP family transcriptional activator
MQLASEPPRFRILGPIELDAVGRVPTGRALSLLALLLLHRGGVVHVDRAIDELWEGARPMHGRKAVHVVASRLRSGLGEDILRSERGGYAVPMESGDLDADRFEGLVRYGRAELAAGDAWEAAATLRRALALWRGPALADVAHARFAQSEIARLEELRLACVSERIDADLACGRHAEVVGELEALVTEHPLRERLRGQQMLALYRAGRQADALEAYRETYEALVDGLGIEPSPDLRALESAILRHEVPAPQAPAANHKPLAADARRLVTCLFARLGHADAATGQDAEWLRAALDRYHDVATEVCVEHDGVVVESRSDAVLAVFGAPVAHEDAAQRALRAASDLVARTSELPVGLRVRCGVGTGEVVAAERRGATTVIGESVGAAERLGLAAAPEEIRIDAPTWRIVRHAARAEPLAGGGFQLDGFDAGAPAIRRRLDGSLVGRERELRLLRESVAATATGRLMAIVGEPGIGKSRLVAELEAVLGDRATVLTGRCPAYGRGMTYWPLRAIVEQAEADLSLDALGVPLSAVRQVEAAVGLRDSAVGEDTGWALLRVVEGLARARPLVLVLDDAHLAEPALLDLLGDVAARLRDAPALIVWVARRDGLDERYPGWAARIESVLELGPLSPAAGVALLEAIDGGRLESVERRRIAEVAGGNPLFLEQLVASIDEQDGALPPALHALLASRMDRLETTERSALALAAVVGDTFETRQVHALADGMSRAELEQACERLVGRELLVRGEGRSIRFRHGLVREVAYASLAKAARARLHERHSEWLAGLRADVPDVHACIGFHLEAACRYEREVAGTRLARLASAAGRRLAAAARVARTRGDLPGEIGFLDRAVALLDDKEGVELLPTLTAALIEAGDSARAEQLAERAVSTSASLGLTGVHAHSAIERERVRLYRHPESFDASAATAVAEHAARAMRSGSDELGLSRAHFLMADLAWLAGDTVASYAHAERMLAHAREAESGVEIANALILATWCLAEGPWPVRDALARLSALAVGASDLRAVELSVMGCRAALDAIAGRYEDAAGAIAEACAGLAELQLSATALYMTMLAGFTAMLAGDPIAAERAARDARVLVADPDDQWYLAWIQVDLAHALLAQGRLAGAAEAVAEIDGRPAPCDAEWVVRRHIARALLAARTGEPGRGLEDARAAVAAAERTGLTMSCAHAHHTRAELLAAAGHRQAAAQAVRRALSLYEAKGNATAIAATRAQFAQLLAQPSVRRKTRTSANSLAVEPSSSRAASAASSSEPARSAAAMPPAPKLRSMFPAAS